MPLPQGTEQFEAFRAGKDEAELPLQVLVESVVMLQQNDQGSQFTIKQVLNLVGSAAVSVSCSKPPTSDDTPFELETRWVFLSSGAGKGTTRTVTL